jgi:hypothetical protein
MARVSGSPIECDRCGNTAVEEDSPVYAAVILAAPNVDDKRWDFCPPCAVAFAANMVSFLKP